MITLLISMRNEFKSHLNQFRSNLAPHMSPADPTGTV